MNTTSLTIVRHAESLLNRVRAHAPVFFNTDETRDRFRNIPDHRVSITEHGFTQANRTGHALSAHGVRYHTAVHSGYTRTKQTLEQLLLDVSVEEVIEDTSFRERESGYGYVMTGAEIEKCFPWNKQYWETVGQIFARPIGGESLMDVCDRLKPAITHLLSSQREKNTLLVTHGRVITLIRFILEKWSLDTLEQFLEDSSQSPVNCGVTIYTFDKDLKPSLHMYNQKYW